MTPDVRKAMKAVLGIVAAFAVFVVAVTLFSRDDGDTLKLAMNDAAGLRDGSPVSIGGVRVGKVQLHLGGGDKVQVDLKLDKGKHVPKDARVGISAVNFLGQKQVAFSGGTPSNPAPDGFVIPASRVTTSTDLDQVLNTLDNDTRTRLSILVNEAGGAVAGRQWDLSRDIQQLPTTLVDAHTLLSQLVSDNHTLADLVTSSDRFIASAAAKRTDLNHVIDTLGQTSKTVETKRRELAATLAKAPGTLATMQRFFGELQRTTTPLGPAARAITATAPALEDTLSRVDAFRKSADPTLNTATDVAPALTKLGTQATPVLRQAKPTLRSLAALIPAAAPLSKALDGSADNLLGTVENWSQAIQLRDGMSHIFRGEATFSPDLVTSVIDRLTKPAAAAPTAKTPARKSSGKTGAGTPSAPAASSPAPDAKPAPSANPVKKVVDGVGKTVTGLLNGLLGPKSAGTQPPAAAAPAAPGKSAQSLLDFLLGP